MLVYIMYFNSSYSFAEKISGRGSFQQLPLMFASRHENTRKKFQNIKVNKSRIYGDKSQVY
jgi:hypothetical protein